MDIEKLKYPIGKFTVNTDYTAEDRMQDVANIKSFPQRLTGVVLELNEEQLNTPYRPDGWTVRQVVHHLADSHINSYIRYRWTLTEDTPVIKAYDEKTWAELPDAKNAPIKFSLNLLKAVHGRWALLFRTNDGKDFSQKLSHPDWKNDLDLDTMTQLYSWHANHHLAHITSLIERNNW